MKTFTYFNPNPTAKIDKKTGKPKRWNKCDCSIRAFCAALNLPWDIVFMEMCLAASRIWDMPDSPKTIESYAKDKGLIKVSLPEYITVREFAEKNDGTYIVNIRSHVACVKNNMIYDTWDCGSYKMKTYYVVKAK